MDKSRKTILISIIPGLLTLVFIVYILIPVYTKMSLTQNALKSEKLTYEENQNQIAILRENRDLNQAVEELNIKLADFNIKVPGNDDLAILLVDLEKFADSQKIKITSLDSKTENPIEIVDPAKKVKEVKKSKKGKKKLANQPALLTEIPLQITVMGYYPNVQKFIEILEKYQRKINIDGVTINSYTKDKDKPYPRVEMVIDCKVYKMVKQEVTPEESTEQDQKEGSTDGSK